MSRLISRLSFAALLALGTAVSAQDAETPAATGAETTGPETGAESTGQAEPGTGSALAQGLDTGREVAQDGSYIRETHEDWQIKCFRTEAEDTPELCQMYQLLKESQGNPVAEFSLY